MPALLPTGQQLLVRFLSRKAGCVRAMFVAPMPGCLQGRCMGHMGQSAWYALHVSNCQYIVDLRASSVAPEMETSLTPYDYRLR